MKRYNRKERKLTESSKVNCPARTACEWWPMVSCRIHWLCHLGTIKDTDPLCLVISSGTAHVLNHTAAAQDRWSGKAFPLGWHLQLVRRTLFCACFWIWMKHLAAGHGMERRERMMHPAVQGRSCLRAQLPPRAGWRKAFPSSLSPCVPGSTSVCEKFCVLSEHTCVTTCVPRSKTSRRIAPHLLLSHFSFPILAAVDLRLLNAASAL